MVDDRKTLDELMNMQKTGRGEETIAEQISYDEILNVMTLVVNLDKAIARKERPKIDDNEMRFMGLVVTGARNVFYNDPSVPKEMRDTLPYVEQAFGRIRAYKEGLPVGSDDPTVRATLDWLKDL